MTPLKQFIFNKTVLWVALISTFALLYALLSITLFTQPSFQQYLTSITPSNIHSTSKLLILLLSLTAIGMPRQISAFTCGYFFNVFLGALYATLIVTIAAYLTYKAASLLQNSYLAIKYEKRLNQLRSFLSINTFSKALIIRLLPVGSNFLTNILAGVAKTPIFPYIGGSFIGFIPQMVIFSLVGSGIKLDNSTHLIAATILFLIAALIGYRLHKSNKS